ncbi:hypothetical protein [Kitasatospora sp. NPDC088134]|uniref:hypothetical protein n=1 Tax=Kitasatospora sp. NPDC088134 TaxID=3364071 RepID=UPI003811364C
MSTRPEVLGPVPRVVLERRVRRSAAPDPYPAAHRQARHELRLLCTLVVSDPASASGLARLVDSDVDRADGALVLGALLHLAGYEEGALFWWGFAAGLGSATAASCRWLHHQALGELADGELWRRRAEELAREPCTGQEGVPERSPVVPRTVRTALLAASMEGLDVTLPPRLAAVLKSLPVDTDDEEYPEVPHWHPDLPLRFETAAMSL